MRDLMTVAANSGLGCIVDTSTWMANRDRAAPFGYDADRLAALNRKAVGLMRDLRVETDRDDVLLALCLGPSGDVYARPKPMRVEVARAYHSVQIRSVADMGIDLVNAYVQSGGKDRWRRTCSPRPRYPHRHFLCGRD